MIRRPNKNNRPAGPLDARLRELRLRLLRLHKTLLDAERADYERVHGATSPGEMLRLVLGHEQFAWLRPLSELIVRIDESLDAVEPLTREGSLELIEVVRALLRPAEGATGFPGHYYARLQHLPEVVLQHSEVLRSLAGDEAR